jgi:hypothetical protein
MESPIPKPVIAKKDNDDKDNNNDNCEAPPSIVQSQVINQSQYSKDNNISSINIGMSELNINPSYNDALEDSSNVKLRSTPNHQEIVNQIILVILTTKTKRNYLNYKRKSII